MRTPAAANNDHTKEDKLSRNSVYVRAKYNSTKWPNIGASGKLLQKSALLQRYIAFKQRSTWYERQYLPQWKLPSPTMQFIALLLQTFSTVDCSWGHDLHLINSLTVGWTKMLWLMWAGRLVSTGAVEPEPKQLWTAEAEKIRCPEPEIWVPVSSEISDFTPSAHAQSIFYISNTLRKLMIRAQGLVFRYVCRVRVRKRKIIDTKSKNVQWLKLLLCCSLLRVPAI